MTWLDGPLKMLPCQNAGQPSQAGQDDSFGEELADHIALARADRLSHADLVGTLGHRHQHDVHDPHAPYQ